MLIEFSEKKTYFVKVVVEWLFCHWMGLVVESTKSEYQSDEGHSTVKGFQTVTALHQLGTSDENIYNFKFLSPIFIKEQLPHYMITSSVQKQQDFGVSCLDETS
jgi:hypothetical protein